MGDRPNGLFLRFNYRVRVLPTIYYQTIGIVRFAKEKSDFNERYDLLNPTLVLDYDQSVTFQS